MLSSIGTVDKVPQFLQAVKDKKQLLMGFGHRVYKSYDPRAKVLKDLSREIFDLVGENPLLTLAQELERQALADSYFVERKLFPNVDFYSGLIYQAMGFPTDMFPVLFWYAETGHLICNIKTNVGLFISTSIPRTAGWLAHWTEMLKDSETKIYRPRQVKM